MSSKTTTFKLTPNEKPANPGNNSRDNEESKPDKKPKGPRETREPYQPPRPDKTIRSILRDKENEPIEDIGFNQSTKNQVPITEINVLNYNVSSDPNIGSFLASVLQAPGSFKQKIQNGTIYYIKKDDYQTFLEEFSSIALGIHSITSPKGYAIDNITYNDILEAYNEKSRSLKIDPNSDSPKIYPLKGTNQTTQVKLNLEPQVKKATEEAVAAATAAAQAEIDKLKAAATAAETAAEAARLKAEAAIKLQAAEIADLKAKDVSQKPVSSAASTAEEDARKQAQKRDREAEPAALAALAEQKVREAEAAAAKLQAAEAAGQAQLQSQTNGKDKFEPMILLIIKNTISETTNILNEIDRVNLEWETNCKEMLDILNPTGKNDKFNELSLRYKTFIDTEIKFKNAKDGNSDKQKLELEKNEKKLLSDDDEKKFKEILNLIRSKNDKSKGFFQSLVIDQERLKIGFDGSIDWKNSTEIDAVRDNTKGKIDEFNNKNKDLTDKINSYYYSLKEQIKLDLFKNLLDQFNIIDLKKEIGELVKSISLFKISFSSLLNQFKEYKKASNDDNLLQLCKETINFYNMINSDGGNTYETNLSNLKISINSNNDILNNITNNSFLLPNKPQTRDKITDIKFLANLPLNKIFKDITFDKPINNEIKEFIKQILGNLVKYVESVKDEDKTKTNEYLILTDTTQILSVIMTNTSYYSSPTVDGISKLIIELQKLIFQHETKITKINKTEFDEEQKMSFLSKFEESKKICEKTLSDFKINEKFTEIEGMKDALTGPLSEETAHLKEYAGKVKEMVEFAKPENIKSKPPGIKELLDKLKDELVKGYEEYDKIYSKPQDGKTWPTDKEKAKAWDELQLILQKIKNYDGNLFGIKLKLIDLNQARMDSETMRINKNAHYRKSINPDENGISHDEKKKRQIEVNKSVNEDGEIKSLRTNVSSISSEVKGLLKKL
jgi:hypothetical protein